MPSIDSTEPKFNGSNWQELNRIIALARFQFLQDDDYEDEGKCCAYLSQRFEGPALDWVASAHATSRTLFQSFDQFIEEVRQAFGVADNNITALLRRDLDHLAWSAEVPSFFAQFDRLTLGLGIASNETKIAMIESKLPPHMKKLLAEQALSFSNYDTMRERLNCMWALDPTRGKTIVTNQTLKTARSRCGHCGRKGHTAPECRGSKK